MPHIRRSLSLLHELFAHHTSDKDYNDHLFVFTGVTDRVPDGGMSAGLLAMGLMAVGLGRKLVK